MRFRRQIRRHRRSASIAFGLAVGLIAGVVIQLAGLSGLKLYGFWVLTICLVLALVAPWALWGTGRRIPIEEVGEPKFRLMRLWVGSEIVVSSRRDGSTMLDNEDFDFLVNGTSYEPYVYVK